jgi:hypothetical protein
MFVPERYIITSPVFRRIYVQPFINAIWNYNKPVKIANKSFENVAKLEYLVTTVSYWNGENTEVKGHVKFGKPFFSKSCCLLIKI